MYIFQYLRYVLKLLPFQGATVPTRDTQGVASLALGWVFHWAFSPHFLNPKVELYICVRAIIYSNMGKRGSVRVWPMCQGAVCAALTSSCAPLCKSTDLAFYSHRKHVKLGANAQKCTFLKKNRRNIWTE